jgi:N,N'-diacetyllegionaminate synthase
MLFKSKVNPVLYIAEVGSNHEGNFLEAKKLVKNASLSNADVIKLQIFTPENMVAKKYEPKRFEHFKRLQLNKKQNLELLKIIKSYKKISSASVWDIDQVSYFKRYIDIFKIGSGDIHNLQIIKKIVKTKKPLILSTGLCDLKDIETTVNFIFKIDRNYLKKRKLAILHCNTSYPTPPEDSNLRTIKYLEEKFKLDIGYSDHTIGDEALVYAYLCGANIIEKHFSNNVKRKTFRDHAISLDKLSVNRFLIKIKKISSYFGLKKKLTSSEKKQNNLYSFRRSVYARRDISKNEKFSEKNIICLRPYINNSSLNFFELLKKKSKKNYKKGDLI